MMKKNLKLLASALGFIFLFYACRTDEMVSSEQRAQDEKIGAFERFENLRSQEILSKETHSSKSGASLPLSYAQPFSEIIYQFLVKHPDFYDKLADDFGEIDYNVASQTFGEDKKYIFYPILKDGKVTSLWYGKLKEDRTWVDFYLVHDPSASTQRMIGEFQNYYSKKAVSRGEPDPPVKEIPGIVITPPSTNPPINDPLPNTGGGGTYTPPYTGDMSGGPIMHGGGTGTSTTQDPCKKITLNNSSAKTLLSQTNISTRKVELISTISTDTKEKSFLFGVKTDGNYDASPVQQGTTYASPMEPTYPDFKVNGGAHTHTVDVYDITSPGDIYVFARNNGINPDFKYLYTFADNNAGYVLTITDPARFEKLYTNYPTGTYFDSETQNWKSTSSIGIDFSSVQDFFEKQGKSDQEAMELAMAFVIGKYNMGVGLSKMDASGNFTSLFVKEKPDPSDPSKKYTKEQQIVTLNNIK